SLLPIPFWAKAINTACYVQNRVLVTKHHNKTPYELLHGRLPSIGFMRPFGYPVTILNTLDPLGKFQRKVDEGFLIGYSVCSKAFRVFNRRTRIIQETLHKSVSPDIHSSSSAAQKRKQGDKTENKDKGKSPVVTIIGFRDLNAEFEEYNNNNSNEVNAASSSVSTAGQNSINSTNDFSAIGPSNPAMPNLEDLSHSNDADNVFFLASKDETTHVLITFILGLENLLSLKVKVIRCDNRIEFKNSDLNQFCGLKGIKREFSVPRSPQQNGIAERKNKTLIKAARTLLADSLLPIPFWAEAVNTACYIQIGCKIQGKVDEGFLVGNSVCSKAFRVFNSRTSIVQETLHVNFMENKPNVAGSGLAWLFDIDSLTRTMNYHPVIAENQTNSHAGLQDTLKAGEEVTHTYVLFLVLSDGSTNSQDKNKDALVDRKEHDDDIQNTNDFSAASPSNTAASPTVANSFSQDASISSHDSDMLNLEDRTHSDDADDVGAEADINNLESIISVSPIPTTDFHKDHPTS
nr:hypothetical protein [Tanacetum cinerariifolium]